jgi:hypothetical protein
MAGIFLAAALAAYPGLVEFHAQGPVTEDGGKPIDVGSYAAPLLADWDGDGLEDLLAGQFDQGRIRFYPNQGDPQLPLFDGFQFLMDGEEFLQVPYG